MITAVMLNWKRPKNVSRIVGGWKSGGMVSEAIVWNNNPEHVASHDSVKSINTSCDMGLYTRFSAASLAKNRCILMQDDDIEIPVRSLELLYSAWERDPGVLHGVFGRNPRPDGGYSPFNAYGEVAVVLTRVLLMDRMYAPLFFLAEPRFADIQASGKPFGNGEDIILSYVARRESGRMNVACKVEVKELPSPNSIHGRDWSGHLSHRSRLIKACEAWISEVKK